MNELKVICITYLEVMVLFGLMYLIANSSITSKRSKALITIRVASIIYTGIMACIFIMAVVCRLAEVLIML